MTLRPRPGCPGSLPAMAIWQSSMAFTQEIGWERRTDVSGLAVMVYADHIDNPVHRGQWPLYGWRFHGRGRAIRPRQRAAARCRTDFSTAGIVATAQRRLPGGNFIRASYVNGDALAMSAPPASTQLIGLAQALAAAHPRRVQMYSLSFSGTLVAPGRVGGPATAGSPMTPPPALLRMRRMPSSLSQPPLPPAHPPVPRWKHAALRPCSMCAICWRKATGPSHEQRLPARLRSGPARLPGGLAFTF